MRPTGCTLSQIWKYLEDLACIHFPFFILMSPSLSPILPPGRDILSKLTSFDALFRRELKRFWIKKLILNPFILYDRAYIIYLARPSYKQIVQDQIQAQSRGLRPNTKCNQQKGPCLSNFKTIYLPWFCFLFLICFLLSTGLPRLVENLRNFENICFTM